MRTLGVVVALLLAPAALAQFGETITVARVLVDARVTEADGEPVTGLAPADFSVRIGGRPAVVESAEWIVDDAEAAIPNGDAHAARPDAGRPGRTLVVFIQTDFGRNDQRLKGQMAFNHRLIEFIRALPPDDRVAVYSFDSQLKFRSDLTTDREAAAAAVLDSLQIDAPSWPPTVPAPSLASRLARDAMRRATSSEAALLLIANALAHIEGPKSLLLVGWGLGTREGRRVSMKRQWKPARQALDASRVSIFALDTTLASYHDLEIGMKSAAAQTGGFYAKTNELAQAAVERLQRTLSGHYELTLRTDAPLRPGTHPLSVRVARRGIATLAPSSVIIHP